MLPAAGLSLFVVMLLMMVFMLTTLPVLVHNVLREMLTVAVLRVWNHMLVVFIRCGVIVLIKPTFVVAGLPRNILLLPVIVS